MCDLQRGWINQPSTLDQLHSLHGTNVLACKESPNLWRVYFLEGPVLSQQVPTKALSLGWRYRHKE